MCQGLQTHKLLICFFICYSAGAKAQAKAKVSSAVSEASADKDSTTAMAIATSAVVLLVGCVVAVLVAKRRLPGGPEAAAPRIDADPIYGLYFFSQGGSNRQ